MSTEFYLIKYDGNVFVLIFLHETRRVQGCEYLQKNKITIFFSQKTRVIPIAIILLLCLIKYKF